jgi:hypothetical protein
MELDQLIRRVRSEYTEMPGLCLTAPQAMRLWGVDAEHVQRVADELVRTAFLARTCRGELVRAS